MLFSYRSSNHKNPRMASIVTMDNAAGIAGNAIFGGALETCTLNTENNVSVRLTKDYFSTFFSINENSTASFIASVPYKVCVCENSRILLTNVLHSTQQMYFQGNNSTSHSLE